MHTVNTAAVGKDPTPSPDEGLLPLLKLLKTRPDRVQVEQKEEVRVWRDLLVGQGGGGTDGEDEGGAGEECNGKGKPHVVDFALAPEDEVCRLEDWVRSLVVTMKKKEIGVEYKERHVQSLLGHIEKVLKQVEKLLEDEVEKAKPWALALAQEDPSVAYEHVVAAALYTHGMSCEKKKVGKECVHADCDQRVSLYEVMNAAMRGVGQCAKCAKTGHTLRELVEEVDEGGGRRRWRPKVQCESCGVSQKIGLLVSFQPLVVRVLGLMRVLPEMPRVVFRGMGARIAHLYKVGGQEVWSSFSSTSDDKGEATKFMQAAKQGTMFAIATCKKAVDIEFGNAYQEKEVLYAPNTVFNVAWKLSPTLLRMLGLQHDVVVLTEEPSLDKGEGCDAAERSEEMRNEIRKSNSLRLGVLLSVMQHTAGYFADFMEKTYVEGRVAGEADALRKDAEELLLKVAKWMEGEVGHRSPLCLLGNGGTGKTSAALAVVGWLLEGNNMSQAAEQKVSCTNKKVFPVFVPLPVLKAAGLLAAGGLDTYVRKSFGLREGELEALSSQFDVVLVLDSLDEVGLAGEELLKELQGEGKESLLSLHPWCSSSCSVILTTRGEYLEAGHLSPSHLCGERVEVLHLQPFAQEDVEAYVDKVVGREEATSVKKALRHPALAKLVSNPFVLHMTVAGRGGLRWMTNERVITPPSTVVSTEVYEIYLRSAVGRRLKELKKEEVEVDSVLAVGELLGCWMLSSGAWSGSINEAQEWLMKVGGELGLEGVWASGLLDDCLLSLPLRVESLEDAESTFTFTHKTVGEYLAGRRLWRSPCETLTKLVPSRRFSKEAPGVLRFFSGWVSKLARNRHTADGVKDGVAWGALFPGLANQPDGDEGGLRSAAAASQVWEAAFSDLLKLVKLTSDDSSGEALVAGSNAMALLCQGGFCFPEGTSLRGVRIRGADLRRFSLGGVDLSGAVLQDNWMEGSVFHNCDLTGTDWEGSSFGVSAPPMRGRGAITKVAVTPDGQKVVGWDNTGELNTWGLATGDLVTRTAVNCGRGLCVVAIAPDCKYAAGGSRDGPLRVWEVATGRDVQSMIGHCGGVTCLAVTYDGKHVVSGGSDKTIRMWDIASGGQAKMLEAESPIKHIALTRDGRVFYVTERVRIEDKVKVWAPESGKEADFELRVHREKDFKYLSVHAFIVSPCGSKVLAAGGNAFGSGGLYFWFYTWELTTEGHVAAQWVQTCSRSVKRLALTPDCKLAVGVDWLHVVNVWNLASRSSVMTLRGHADIGCSLAMTPDGRRAVCGCKGVVRLWDIAACGEEVYIGRGYITPYQAMSLTPDGRRVVCQDPLGVSYVLDLASGKQVMTTRCPGAWNKYYDRRQRGVLAITNSKIFIDNCPELTVWKLERGAKTRGEGLGVAALAATPDGRQVVTGFRDNTVCVCDLEGGVQVTLKGARFTENGKKKRCVYHISHDGCKVVGNCADTVSVWSPAGGEPLVTMKITSQVPVFGLAGGHVVVGRGVWDPATGRRVAGKDTSSYTAHCILLGQWTVGSDGASLCVWDGDTGMDVVPPLPVYSGVVHLKAALDGKTFASGGTDGTTCLWGFEGAEGGGKPKVRLLSVIGNRHALVEAMQCTGVGSVTPASARRLFK